KAIFARDKGCQAPGCMIQATYCQCHHCKEWSTGGQTNEDNAITLCAHHHADVHNGKWTIRKVDGVTYFQPANLVDPYQPLLRNLYWNIQQNHWDGLCSRARGATLEGLHLLCNATNHSI